MKTNSVVTATVTTVPVSEGADRLSQERKDTGVGADLEGSSAASRSYVQILVSSALIGGSSMINIGISMIRTKLLAVMLGPAGFGLLASFTVITDAARSWAALGMNSSGVRQIAESNGTGNKQRIGLTIVVLRRTALVLGVLGAIALALLSGTVSRLTFGDEAQAGPVALLGLVVFFRMVSDGQGALLQGMRRIGDMARGGIIGTAAGSVLMLLAVYFYRERGLALALVLGAAASAGIFWFYSRRIKVARVDASNAQMCFEAGQLLRLGLAFMVSGLLMTGATYAVRVILIKFEGLEAAGIYQAAWTLGGLYVGFILQAMGADFYPRLVGAAGDDIDTNRLVNEQSRVSILLAGPGVLCTLVLAPLCVSFFYTSEFAPAGEILRWICMGMALRIISWPMGFIIVSRNRQLAFIATELAWTIVNVGATLVLVRYWGMTGVGAAFFLSYVFHVAIIYPVVRQISGFRWEPDNFRSAVLFIGAMGCVTAAYAVLPPIAANAFGLIAVLGACAYSIHNLATLVPRELVPKRLHRLVYWFQRNDSAEIASTGVESS